LRSLARSRAFSFKILHPIYIDFMSVEQIESKLMELSADERKQFARWFYDHEDKFLNCAVENIESEELKAQILNRRDELLSNPGLGVPVTREWFKDLKEKFSRARPDKASAS
jgi:hypothetical protein